MNLALRVALMGGASITAPSEPPPPTPWILATGVWNDAGVWDDTAIWSE